MNLNSFVDKIFCINLDSRKDRWDECLDEFIKLNVKEYERFPGIVVPGNGNYGCTKSHRTLLRKIHTGPWNKVLVLEDDFMALPHDWDNHDVKTNIEFAIRNKHVFQFNADGFYENLSTSIQCVPDDFDILYLGGHYGSNPLARINKHILKIDTMLTTSSYIITKEFAGKLGNDLDNEARREIGFDKSPEELLNYYVGPIDSIYSKFLNKYNSYIIQPRLFIQRPGMSDLTERMENHHHAMMVISHELRL